MFANFKTTDGSGDVFVLAHKVTSVQTAGENTLITADGGGSFLVRGTARTTRNAILRVLQPASTDDAPAEAPVEA